VAGIRCWDQSRLEFTKGLDTSVSEDQKIALSVMIACVVAGFVAVVGIYLAIAMAWDDFSSRKPGKNAHDAGARQGMQLLGRALRLKCPACGKGRILNGYFGMNERCPECHARFWLNEGEWVGPSVISFIAAVGTALLTWAVTEFFALPYWTQLLLPATAAVLVALAITPLTRSFWTLFLYISHEGVDSRLPPP
jgi:uncharacterized protein (DUF983 family)